MRRVVQVSEYEGQNVGGCWEVWISPEVGEGMAVPCF